MQTEIIKNEYFGREYTIEYELYQSYSRFNVYNVYKIYKKDNQKIFLYRETKARSDYGRRLLNNQELLNQVNKRIGYHCGNKS